MGLPPSCLPPPGPTPLTTPHPRYWAAILEPGFLLDLPLAPRHPSSIVLPISAQHQRRAPPLRAHHPTEVQHEGFVVVNQLQDSLTVEPSIIQHWQPTPVLGSGGTSPGAIRCSGSANELICGPKTQFQQHAMQLDLRASTSDVEAAVATVRAAMAAASAGAAAEVAANVAAGKGCGSLESEDAAAAAEAAGGTNAAKGPTLQAAVAPVFAIHGAAAAAMSQAAAVAGPEVPAALVPARAAVAVMAQPALMQVGGAAQAPDPPLPPAPGPQYFTPYELGWLSDLAAGPEASATAQSVEAAASMPEGTTAAPAAAPTTAPTTAAATKTVVGQAEVAAAQPAVSAVVSVSSAAAAALAEDQTQTAAARAPPGASGPQVGELSGLCLPGSVWCLAPQSIQQQRQGQAVPISQTVGPLSAVPDWFAAAGGVPQRSGLTAGYSLLQTAGDLPQLTAFPGVASWPVADGATNGAGAQSGMPAQLPTDFSELLAMWQVPAQQGEQMLPQAAPYDALALVVPQPHMAPAQQQPQQQSPQQQVEQQQAKQQEEEQMQGGNPQPVQGGQLRSTRQVGQQHTPELPAEQQLMMSQQTAPSIGPGASRQQLQAAAITSKPGVNGQGAVELGGAPSDSALVQAVRRQQNALPVSPEIGCTIDTRSLLPQGHWVLPSLPQQPVASLETIGVPSGQQQVEQNLVQRQQQDAADAPPNALTAWAGAQTGLQAPANAPGPIITGIVASTARRQPSLIIQGNSVSLGRAATVGGAPPEAPAEVAVAPAALAEAAMAAEVGGEAYQGAPMLSTGASGAVEAAPQQCMLPPIPQGTAPASKRLQGSTSKQHRRGRSMGTPASNVVIKQEADSCEPPLASNIVLQANPSSRRSVRQRASRAAEGSDHNGPDSSSPEARRGGRRRRGSSVEAIAVETEEMPVTGLRRSKRSRVPNRARALEDFEWGDVAVEGDEKGALKGGWVTAAEGQGGVAGIDQRQGAAACGVEEASLGTPASGGIGVPPHVPGDGLSESVDGKTGRGLKRQGGEAAPSPASDGAPAFGTRGARKKARRC